MIKTISNIEASPLELRQLVKWSVAQLGSVIKKEAGSALYQLIEQLRKQMADLRVGDEEATGRQLELALGRLRLLKPKERLVVARSYTLMLELINSCENAYRSYRLSERDRHPVSAPEQGAIIYVLTSHPTEARSPESIAVFHNIQRILIRALNKESEKTLEQSLSHELGLAWRVSVMRERAPHVRDEAEHIYSTLLRDETLSSLLAASREVVPVYVRTWVGGDKDGHPGVDEKVMFESLSLSRQYLIRYVNERVSRVRETLALLPREQLHLEMANFARLVLRLRIIKKGDGALLKKLRPELVRICRKYQSKIGFVHPALLQLQQLLHVFPGLVVPLELRESSDVLMSTAPNLAIDRMLRCLAKISQGGDPRWYARGFIVSMTDSLEHIQVAARKVRAAFGRARIPVIPLFEQRGSLERADKIVTAMIHDRLIGRDIRTYWNNTVEMMMGYSDSSKESGVLPSRLAIAEAMNRLDLLCRKENVQALFFQGSGGSVDRGGGPVQDQSAWWPHSALKVYKVTIQGEMVERSLSSPEITRGQIERISQSVQEALSKPVVVPHVAVVQELARQIAEAYRQMIRAPEFLRAVEMATPYPDLSELKIGSRPTSRSTQLAVEGLRAIPWVLCWTQTRVLFQTWWGIGTAWENLSQAQRLELREAYRREPVFSSFVKALGFTLAKVELSVWKIYLKESDLPEEVTAHLVRLFDQEFRGALEFLEFITEQKNPLWYQPWLGASIRLRTPMIHPLNLLQILAIEKKDFSLLRCTVTGIASGMLTTG